MLAYYYLYDHASCVHIVKSRLVLYTSTTYFLFGILLDLFVVSELSGSSSNTSTAYSLFTCLGEEFL